jgi:hypothetical protein
MSTAPPAWILPLGLFSLFSALQGVGAESVGGANPPVDKSQYHLFNPTPSDQLREMATDRPDKTESAYTVDAGRFQIEMDLVSYTHDRQQQGGVTTKTETWNVVPVNLKVGLTHRLDAQLVLRPYNEVKTETTGAPTVHQRGFGDVTARLKYNLWGNDGGPTAFALMPYVKLPTNQDDLGNSSVEGGLIVPMAVQLPFEFGLGLMTVLDLNRDSSEGGHHAEFLNSITLSHDLIGKLEGYIEFFGAVSTESGVPWQGTVDFGFTYPLTENIQLDCGANVGITASADDINPFVGLSFRF